MGRLLVLIASFLLLAAAARAQQSSCPTTSPPVWPLQFVLVQRKVPDDASGNATTVTYYDWAAQANLIVITSDADEANPLWDLELGTGQSYYFQPAEESCQSVSFPVGILRPDWLANATFVGETTKLGKKVLAWTKEDFIDYYADINDCSPVSWYFHSMQARFDTVYWAPGALTPAHAATNLSYFTPPDYCLKNHPSVKQP